MALSSITHYNKFYTSATWFKVTISHLRKISGQVLHELTQVNSPLQQTIAQTGDILSAHFVTGKVNGCLCSLLQGRWLVDCTLCYNEGDWLTVYFKWCNLQQPFIYSCCQTGLFVGICTSVSLHIVYFQLLCKFGWLLTAITECVKFNSQLLCIGNKSNQFKMMFNCICRSEAWVHLLFMMEW